MDAHPNWDWSAINGMNAASTSVPEPDTTQARRRQQADSTAGQSSHETPRTGPSRQRHYGPRSCRICLEVEQPKFPTGSTTLGISTASTRPTYGSDDPELGRLLSPCKCKGSQKYVHEGCLNAWRLANPSATRNYWQCPTCKFTYRLSRLHWASMLSSGLAQVGLTIVMVIISLFILGFIADPLFDLWYDPFGTLTDTVVTVISDVEANDRPLYEEPATWSEHFAKGFFSLGIVGLAKTMFAMTPWQWFYYRGSGGLMGGGGRRAGTGRGRVENLSWIFIIIGAFTFLMAVWKFVKAISARVLKNVSDRVMDVGGDDDDDEDESRKDT